MYNRSPVAGYRVADGVNGGLMGRTLGFLALLLFILSATALVSPLAGEAGMWVGIGGAILGTIMVSRNVARPGRAFLWGAIVAIGMGLLVGPVLWSVAITQPSLIWSSLGILLVAILFSALLVSWIPWDFSRIMPLLFMGLIMLMVTGFLSFLIPGMSGVMMSKAYNLIGVVVFVGYMVVDFSWMRHRNRMVPANGAAVLLAVSLLIDIVNLFLFILRLGRR